MFIQAIDGKFYRDPVLVGDRAVLTGYDAVTLYSKVGLKLGLKSFGLEGKATGPATAGEQTFGSTSQKCKIWDLILKSPIPRPTMTSAQLEEWPLCDDEVLGFFVDVSHPEFTKILFGNIGLPWDTEAPYLRASAILKKSVFDPLKVRIWK